MAHAPSAIVGARRLRRRSATAAVVVVVSAPLAVVGCDEGPRTPPSVVEPPPLAATVPARPWLVEVTTEVGLHFRHQAAITGGYRMQEIMGSGGAVLDFDGDGRLDVYLVNGDRPAGARDQLCRQMPDGTFRDVAAAAGLEPAGYGMGCVAADVDDDGDTDLYLTNFGPDELWINRGDGTFRNATATSGLDNDAWSVSAAFFDYDRDGRLDLYVANYLARTDTRQCTDESGVRDYCGPQHFPPARDRLYRNEGGGVFRDVTATAGISTRTGPGLGVACDDFDGDGWCDVYVANDQAPNLLWINQRDGTFIDHAAGLGLAYNADGAAEAGMGIAVGDADGDAADDLFITHFSAETNTLYRRTPDGSYDDVSYDSRLGPPSLRYTGFGTAFVDLDHDGDLDLLVGNGAVNRRSRPVGGAAPGALAAYAEPNLVFENDGAGVFAERGPAHEPFAAVVEVSRGVLVGDLDGDGDADCIVTNTDGPARVYRGNASDRGAWLAVRPTESESAGPAIGAQVSVRTGDRIRRRTITAGAGYAGSNEPVARFGLGAAEAVEAVQVRWPDGGCETFPGGATRRSIDLVRGHGAEAMPW